ncbi:hypothetical protein [Roseateles asaccharophilus]|uniref:Uncharacterized protein n=1 Tax=Roseateles asaccharophilus TaxID=582607 RepID=A0ABU2A4Y1_9BURK|nr:hypothetical protein [Roseateles asaccharophilus]MDR7332254.1 hypothetical protein [Roseateles asaccharophilus]
MADEVLSVVIGVVFVFMLFSLFLSASLEAISATLKLRGRALRVALARLIDDPAVPVTHGGFGLMDKMVAAKPPAELVADAVDSRSPELHEVTFADGDPKPFEPLRFAAVFCHPLVAGASGKSTPSYVPLPHFTSALLQALLQERPEASVDAVAARVALLPPGQLRTALEGALLDARGDWDALRAGIDRWYGNAMDRLSGEYKRFSQFITFLLGFVLAASFNIDAIALARQLYADPVMREALAQQAAQYVAAHPPAAASAASAPASAPDAEARYRQAVDQWVAARDQLTRTVPGATTAADMPTPQRIREGWLGWVVTALAGMLGAPFWFDLLQKLTNLRGTGPKPAGADDKK